MAPTRSFPAKSLTHPLFLTALLLLVVNDHALKGAGLLPGEVTGKLSDFAGLVVAPTVVAWCLQLRARRAWLAAHAVVGAVFASLEIVPALCDLVERISAPVFALRMVPDLTDLIALPALAASYALLGPRSAAAAVSPRALPTPAGKALGMAALLACCASSRMPPARVVADDQHLYAQKFQYGTFAILDGRSGAMQRIVKPYTPGQPPLAFGDAIYLAGDSKRPGLVAIRIDTGETLYRTLDRRPPMTLVAIDERHVYGTRHDERGLILMVMERANGSLFGEVAIDAGIEGAAFKSIGPGRVAVLARGEITVHAPVADEGKLKAPTGEDFVDFAVEGDRLVAATDGGALVGFDLSRPTVPSFTRFDADAIRGRSTMTIAGGVLAYTTSDGAALVQAASGRAIASVADAWLFSLDRTGFYAFADGAVLASELDGRRRWSVSASFDWPASLAVTNDAVAIRDGDALLFGYDKRHGAPIFRFDFEAIPSGE